MSDLTKKYGAEGLRKAMMVRKDLPIDIAKLSDMQFERLMVEGQMLGWKQNFDLEPPENPLPVFDYGEYEPIGHLKNFIDLCWEGAWRWSETMEPSTNSTGSFRVINHFSTRCMYDLVNRSRCGPTPAAYNMLCGPASSSKTATAALYALSMFFVFRKTLTAKLVSTSATSAEERIWGALVNLFETSYYGKNPIVHNQGKFHLLGGNDRRLLFLQNGTTVDDYGETKTKFKKSYLTGITLVPVQRGADGEGAVRRLAGIKAPMKLLIVDESTDTDPSVFDEKLLINWSVAKQFAQVAYLLNPRHEARRSVSFLEPAGGWKSPEYHEESPGWPTKKDGWVTQLNGLDTPNRHWRAVNDPQRKSSPVAPFPFLICQTDIDAAEKRFGRGTPAFNTMCVGFLCSESATNTIFTLRMLEESGSMGVVNWAGDGSYPLFGVDPAFGGDRFCICIGNLGYGYEIGSTRRKVFLEIEKFVYAPFIEQVHGSAEAGQVRFFQELCAEHGIGAESIASDSTGSSMSFVNAAEIAMGGKQFHRVSFAAAASERQAGPGEIKKACDKFNDSKSEIVYSVRDYLPFIRGLTNDLAIDQGVARQFFVKNKNKLCVEMKSEYQKRLGLGSPDELDSLAILTDIARSCGLGTETLSHPLAAAARLTRTDRIVVRRRYSNDPRGTANRYRQEVA